MRSLQTALCLLGGSLLAHAATNPRPYPQADAYLQTTSFLDRESYLTNLDDHQWYLDNIPFIDIPDTNIQDVYYYRASVIKRHLKWAHEGHGWVVTEFIHPVAWASKFQAIPDSSPHHVVELRWLRDLNYVKDLIQTYTRGGLERINGVSYTHYMHRAILEYAQATGDVEFLTSQLEGLELMYSLWDGLRNNVTGLYHWTPLADAQEYSLPGYLTGGPGGGPVQAWNDFGLSAAQGGGNNYDTIWLGPETYRPSFDSYMVANARALSQVYALAGNTTGAQYWSDYAERLYDDMLALMYSDELNFWIDVVEGTNLRCEGRELIGYYPYRFDVGTNATFIQGLEAATDTEHFITEFGPTTLEQTNPYYTALKNSTYCCMWNGQSWPFSTSVYLGTLARIARNGLSNIITPELFNAEMKKYAVTNYKDGVPYVAESHYPTMDMWSGDTTNHSENYLHSTYLDNVFTNLFGIVPEFGDVLQLQPLVPSNWSYFAIENLPYHGSLLTFIWDQNGTHYSGSNTTAGFSIYSNGTLFYHSNTLSAVNVTLPFDTASAAAQLAAQPEWQNIVANPNSPYNLPSITSDWNLLPNGDIGSYEAWKLNDGLLWYDTTPDNRWTNNQSEVPYSTITITLPRPRAIHSISLAIFDDTARGGVAACPAALSVVDGQNQTVAYVDPWTDCVPNALNTIVFAAPTPLNSTSNTTTAQDDSGYTTLTDTLVLTLSDQLRYTTAVSEIQLWVAPELGPRYEVEDGVIGTFIGSFEGLATGLNGTIGDGGVTLGETGWVELAGVRTADGEASGNVSLTVMGGGTGTVEVQLNWLRNYTVSFEGEMVNKTVEVSMLRGGNVVTIFQTSGMPFLDAIVVA